MKYNEDKRIVMTLDAGGTTLVFSAIQGNEQVVEEITLPSSPDNLEIMFNNLVEGFSTVKSKLKEKPVAISFAFPGPADYSRGIILDLPNLPAFRGGVAMGPFLEEKFGIPVFINNDGDLFAYGEAISGFLPEINKKLEESGSPKRYKNLAAFTIGTGFGCGLVRDGELLTGDNSAAGEVWLFRDKLGKNINIENHVSIRGVKRTYSRITGIPENEVPEPKVLYKIAKGESKGEREAALNAFGELAEAAGDAIAHVVTLIDGLVVIGGGLSRAWELFLQEIINEMNSKYTRPSGEVLGRLIPKAYNLEDEKQLTEFLSGSKREILVPGTSRSISYDAYPRTGVAISKIGTARAVSLGAYAFAINKLG